MTDYNKIGRVQDIVRARGYEVGKVYRVPELGKIAMFLGVNFDGKAEFKIGANQISGSGGRWFAIEIEEDTTCRSAS